MGDQGIDDIVARLRETFPNVDQRFALIVYRDQGDQYVSRCFDFTDSLDDLRGKLSRQRAAGGGDMPEAVHIALEQAAGLDWRLGNVARVAFLVGDAPPHDSDILAAFEAANGLRAGGVRLYPVASSGVDLKAEFFMRSAALLTMGQYLLLTDHSGIGNPHAKPHTSQYRVDRPSVLPPRYHRPLWIAGVSRTGYSMGKSLRRSMRWRRNTANLARGARNESSQRYLLR